MRYLNAIVLILLVKAAVSQTMCYDHILTSYQIRKIQDLSTDSIIEDERVGYSKVFSLRYKTFKQLVDSSSVVDLTALITHQNKDIIFYGFWGVLMKGEKRLANNIYRKFSSNQQLVNYQDEIRSITRPLNVIMAEFMVKYHNLKVISLSENELKMYKTVVSKYLRTDLKKDIDFLKEKKKS